MEDEMFCPASMCPLFAPTGSPWTGEFDVTCLNDKCGFWYKGHCDAASGAKHQVCEMEEGSIPLQIGPIRMKRSSVSPKQFDCPNAYRCQWQKEAGENLCPPRFALSKGVDPRVCAY